MKPEKQTLEHLKTCLIHEQMQKTLTLDRLVRYINGIEEWAIEVGKTEAKTEFVPTEIHLTMRERLKL